MGMGMPKVGLIIDWDAEKSSLRCCKSVGRSRRDGGACLCITVSDKEHLKRALRQARRAMAKEKHRREQRATAIRKVRKQSGMECGASIAKKARHVVCR